MTDFEQLPLFGPGSVDQPRGEVESAPLKPETSLHEAIDVYLVALQLRGASFHTVRAFRSDLNLLAGWSGKDRPISQFATSDLNKFLHWMLTERDKPCSPKSYARRATALKNFFSYLYEEGAISSDPAAALIQQPATSPLPEVLLDEEIERVLAVTQQMRVDREKPDARPHLLVTLLLTTGIKKSECMALTINDVDRTDPTAPFIWIRYASPSMRFKERKIAVEPTWPELLDEYLRQRRPERAIFDCTARNLEYVLRDIADVAGVPRKKLSFEGLRWTCAVRDYRSGMKHETLRQKLGLSRISWRETSTRLEQLAKGTQTDR